MKIFKIVTLAVLLLLSSCTPEIQKRLATKKIEKLIKKYDLEDFTKLTQSDTVFLNDTITFGPLIVENEITKWNYDTIYTVKQDGVITKIQIRPDTVWFKTEVLKRDTIVQDKIITNTQTKYLTVPAQKDNRIRIWTWIVLIILSLVYLRWHYINRKY